MKSIRSGLQPGVREPRLDREAEAYVQYVEHRRPKIGPVRQAAIHSNFHSVDLGAYLLR